jgi:MtN3 and saliva related transmembrane protein
MSSFLIETIGVVAAALTTLCWVPQAIKVIRTRHTSDLSLIAQAVFAAGVLLWLVYGALIISWPLIIANAITLAVATTILVLKLRYG